MEMNTYKPYEKIIKYRRTKDIKISDFKYDLVRKLSYDKTIIPTTMYLNTLIDKYNSSEEILDKHAPEKTGKVVHRKPTPWTNADIKKFKKEKRKAEKRWKRTRLVIDLNMYKEKRNAYNKLLKELKSKDLSKRITENKGNTKAMFKIINSMLNRKQSSPLPPHNDDITLANDFNAFFGNKIHTLRANFDHLPDLDFNMVNKCATLSSFRCLSEVHIRELIREMPTKHCILDPLPTWLIKECIDEFLPLMTDIVNTSLQLGVMPKTLKHAIVKPLLKKSGADLLKKNYRPVSNLSFLGKLIESAVISQYTAHLEENKLQDPRQSAYKKFHSTETLLTKIHNDIIHSLSNGEVIILVLLDLSAAFDTIDHDILEQRLKCHYGVDGTALKWFKSYISQRTQSVLVNESLSSVSFLKYGVPQGSKLGPILFNSYIAPLSEVAQKYNIIDEKYADDEQLILSFKPKSPSDTRENVLKLEKCINDIKHFLANNKLCFNSEKTELLLIGNPQQLKKLNINSIKIDTTEIKAVNNVRNLGVFFDRHMTMERQVNHMCRNVFLNLKNISKIRKTLSMEDTKTVVNALVTPHLDYGNALLFGIPKKLENKLQVAQNSAVRLIHRIKKREGVTFYRKELHWLPISARIHYKIATMVWKILKGQSPMYLNKLIKVRDNPRNLRINHKCILEIPDVQNLPNSIERSFSRSAPKIWNNLPDDLRLSNSLNSFKKNLKTYLFRIHYGE